jgi:hypothetical protein
MAQKPPRFVRIVRVRLRRLARGLERGMPEWWKLVAPWGSSLVLHAAILLTLGMMYYATASDQGRGKEITTEFPQQLKEDVTAAVKSDHAGDPFTTLKSDEPPSLAPEPDASSDVIAVAELTPAARLGEQLRLDATGATANLLGPAAEGTGKAFVKPGDVSAPFSGRQGVTRAKLVRREGGSVESERAVERGLDWLARHQRKDGSWSLNHRPQCRGKGCPPDKCMESDTAATGLALLPLLGAGQVQTEKGRYQKVVDSGLQWLVKAQKPDGDLWTGGTPISRMYSHAIGTMALCEAYGVTKDPALKGPAQKALDFIVRAQNKDDGGWRYEPGMPGDTSVFGWQMFALRSGFLAGLEVPDAAVQGCRRYLDKAAVDSQGSTYCYLPSGGGHERKFSPVMTAEALLGRQYLGWKREYPALQQGGQLVAANLLESQDRNIYYWYYGTQLLHNMQGPAWQLWNLKIRDGLIGIQVVGRGCDNGSWSPVLPVPDQWGKEAGRHFVTSLSLLTLEVYYRYLPLYRERDKNPVGGKDSDASAEGPKGPIAEAGKEKK